MAEKLIDYVIEQYNEIILSRFEREKIFELMEIDTESSKKLINNIIKENRELLFTAVTLKLNNYYDASKTKDFYKIICNKNSPVSVFGEIRSNMLLNDFSMFPLLTLPKD